MYRRKRSNATPEAVGRSVEKEKEKRREEKRKVKMSNDCWFSTLLFQLSSSFLSQFILLLLHSTYSLTVSIFFRTPLLSNCRNYKIPRFATKCEESQVSEGKGEEEDLKSYLQNIFPLIFFLLLLHFPEVGVYYVRNKQRNK
jgi:hypothetical protein